MPQEKRKVLVAVSELCTGCRLCELVCSLQKGGAVNPYQARIRVTWSREGFSPAPVICRHCKAPPCLDVCPVEEAMRLDPITGAVIIDQDRCLGCLACVDACPFHAIAVGPDREVLKCDLCGGEPLCVRYCPPRPERGLPHLPWPKQSCLQYVEPHRVGRHGDGA